MFLIGLINDEQELLEQQNESSNSKFKELEDKLSMVNKNISELNAELADKMKKNEKLKEAYRQFATLQ